MIRTKVEIPPRMKHLPRDKRGYPIPAIVLRDNKGDPHFTINDTRVALTLIGQYRCGICGGQLGTHKWFVGGPAAAFHKMGAYLDGPVHRECGTYALQVCPYLALAGSYSRRIEGKTLAREDMPADAMVLLDHTVHPDQPAVFVFGDTSDYAINPRTMYLHPERPWRQFEFWRGGERITDAEARALVANDPKLPVPFSDLEWLK